MKKLLFAVSILFCLSANAQKDSTKDTVIVLSVAQANQLLQDIQIQASGKADIKIEQWNNDAKMIVNSVKIIADKPKK